MGHAREKTRTLGARHVNVVRELLRLPRARLLLALAVAGCGGSAKDGPPSITQQPQSLTQGVGGTATFTVGAEGAAPLTYQWRRNGVAIDAALGDTLTTGVLLASDDGTSYDVVVTNALGSVVSDAALLTVSSSILVAPALLQQPQEVTVGVGGAATFTVSASGSQPLFYQWRRSGLDLVGETSPEYVLPASSIGDDGAEIDVVVHNAAGSVTSAIAILHVTAPVAPMIVTSPASVDVVAGQLASFSVLASGSGPLTYQWIREGTDIPGATGLTYSFMAALADDGDEISVRVTNSAGTATSEAATLDVHLAPPTAWRTAIRLEESDEIAYQPSVAVDEEGNAIVLWRQKEGASSFVFARRYDHATDAWSTAEKISVAGGPASAGIPWFPDVSTLPNGDALAAWAQAIPNPGGPGSVYQIYSALYVRGTGWMPKVPVGTGSPDNGIPTVAIRTTPQGAAFLVWMKARPVGSAIDGDYFASVRNGFGNWSDEHQLHTTTGSINGLFSLTTDLDGNALVAWSSLEGSGTYSTLAVRYVVNSGWKAAQELRATLTGYTDVPRVAFGHVAMVMFNHGFAGNFNSVPLASFASGVWSGEMAVDPADRWLNSQDVSVGASGAIFSVFERSGEGGGLYSVVAGRHTAAGGWVLYDLETSALDARGCRVAGAPQAEAAGFEAHAVWRQTDGTRFGLYGRRYLLSPPGFTAVADRIDRASELGGAENVSMSNLELASSPSGHAATVWLQHDGTRDNVWANVFRE